jgi:hypothetical protein
MIADNRMDASETTVFLSFIKKVDGLLGQIEPSLSEWRFIDVAMSFLVKAHFCELSSGFEQLLWHIVAVEAALGESSRVSRNGSRGVFRLSLLNPKTKLNKSEMNSTSSTNYETA